MKKALRKEAMEKRAALGKKELLGYSAKIADRVLALEEVESAESISCYVAIGSEVKTHALLARLLGAGKKVLVPAVFKDGGKMEMCSILSLDELDESGKFFEPRKECRRITRPEKIDVMLVPGVAFDGRGFRLGYGKGYYDRYLESMGRSIPLIGLAFACQLVERIPEEGHDVHVDKIVTEKRVINCAVSHSLDRIAKGKRSADR